MKDIAPKVWPPGKRIGWYFLNLFSLYCLLYNAVGF